MKKILSVILCLVLVTGMFSVSIYAEGTDPDTSEDDFDYEVIDGKATINKYKGSDVDVVIPDTVAGCPVTSIGGYAFYGCSSLTNVTIPESVTSIGPYAFDGCRSLTGVMIPGSVADIGFIAFGMYYSADDDAYCPIEGFVIYGKRDSSAENYAETNGIAFVEICGHSLTRTARKEAACTAAGNIEYWTCEKCHKLFSDENGIKEIRQADTVVEAKGHDWGEWEVVARPTYTAEGLERRFCKSDESHVEERVTDKLVPEYTITLDKTEAALAYGKTMILTAAITSTDASEPEVTWTSSDKKIADVTRSGKVTAKGVGTATITASLEDGTNAACEVTVKKAASTITLNAKTADYTGKPINIDPATVKGSKGKVTYTYYSDSACKKKVSAHKNAGTYYVKAKVAADSSYKGAVSSAVKLKIKKIANTMTADAKTGLTAGSKAKTTITKAKAFTIGKAQGKVTFKKIKGDAKITVASNGAVTVKKGLKKGTAYSVTVKVTAAGNTNYKPGSKTVTLKIKVK